MNGEPRTTSSLMGVPREASDVSAWIGHDATPRAVPTEIFRRGSSVGLRASREPSRRRSQRTSRRPDGPHAGRSPQPPTPAKWSTMTPADDGSTVAATYPSGRTRTTVPAVAP
jgi:hypothetical protein